MLQTSNSSIGFDLNAVKEIALQQHLIRRAAIES